MEWGKNQVLSYIVKGRIVSYVLISVLCIHASHTLGKNEKKYMFLIINCPKKGILKNHLK